MWFMQGTEGYFQPLRMTFFNWVWRQSDLRRPNISKFYRVRLIYFFFYCDLYCEWGWQKWFKNSENICNLFLLFQINQLFNLDRQEKENLARPDFTIQELSALLNQLESVSLLRGRLQLNIVKNEEDNFFGLQRLFYFSEIYVDWRVRLHFVQFSYETVFLLRRWYYF